MLMGGNHAILATVFASPGAVGSGFLSQLPVPEGGWIGRARCEHRAESTQQEVGQNWGGRSMSVRILYQLHVRGGEEAGNPGHDADNLQPCSLGPRAKAQMPPFSSSTPYPHHPICLSGTFLGPVLYNNLR